MKIKPTNSNSQRKESKTRQYNLLGSNSDLFIFVLQKDEEFVSIEIKFNFFF